MAKKLDYPPMKVGDTAGLLQYRLLSKGNPVDITATDSIVFRMINRDTGAVITDDLAGSVVDGLEGLSGYQRLLADVDTEQPVIMQFTINFTSGDVHVSPDIHSAIVKDI